MRRIKSRRSLSLNSSKMRSKNRQTSSRFFSINLEPGGDGNEYLTLIAVTYAAGNVAFFFKRSQRGGSARGGDVEVLRQLARLVLPLFVDVEERQHTALAAQVVGRGLCCIVKIRSPHSAQKRLSSFALIQKITAFFIANTVSYYSIYNKKSQGNIGFLAKTAYRDARGVGERDYLAAKTCF